MKNKKRKQKKILLNQKKNLRIFTDYLVDSYYLNPSTEYNINDIFFELKIENCGVFETYINFLKKKKFIKTQKEKFIITFEGFEYLEKVQRTNKEYENNLCNITVSMIAMLISIFGIIFDNEVVHLILIVALFIFMDVQTKDIFNKKYY